MALFPLINEDRGNLKRLNENKATVFALKKLFLNTAIKGTMPQEVQVLAAERIAIDIIQDAFHDLETIQPENITESNRDNTI